MIHPVSGADGLRACLSALPPLDLSAMRRLRLSRWTAAPNSERVARGWGEVCEEALRSPTPARGAARAAWGQRRSRRTNRTTVAWRKGGVLASEPRSAGKSPIK
jgi:hypothetical protein